MIAGLKETVGILRTTISSDESKKHVYEICREFDTNELFITILAFIHLFSPSHAILDHIGGTTKKAFFLAYQ